MEWYRTTKDEFEEKKKGKQLLLDFIKEKKIKSEGRTGFVIFNKVLF